MDRIRGPKGLLAVQNSLQERIEIVVPDENYYQIFNI